MTSDFSSSANRGISRAQSKLNDVFSKLASGKRIQKASDDPAGLAVVASLEASATTLKQGSRNVSDTQSALEIADSALGQISDIASRLSELSAQAANGTLSDTQRQALQSEYSELTQEVQRIAETTEFNGKKVLSGDSISTQVGTSSDPSSQVNYGGVDVSALVASVSSGNISSQAGAQAAIGNVQSFISTVASARGDVGAASSRLDAAQKNNESQQENAIAAASRIRDEDVAQRTAELVSERIKLQTGTALAAQANLAKAAVQQLLS
jgi:flagellin